MAAYMHIQSGQMAAYMHTQSGQMAAYMHIQSGQMAAYTISGQLATLTFNKRDSNIPTLSIYILMYNGYNIV